MIKSQKIINKFAFIIISIFITNSIVSQDLIEEDWLSCYCGNEGGITSLKIETGSNGDIYILSRLSGIITCSEKEFDKEKGEYLLTKFNRNGESLWSVNFGSSGALGGSDMKINSKDESIIGIATYNEFYFDGVVIDSTKGKNSSVISVDINGNLSWHKLIESKNSAQSYVWKITLDNFNNVYTSMQILDSIIIENDEVGQDSGYGALLLKLTQEGILEWYNHFHSDDLVRIREIGFLSESNTNNSLIVVSGFTHADSLFINGKLQGVKNTGSNLHHQNYLMTIDLDGNIIKTFFAPPDLRVIDCLSTYQGRIYIGGGFKGAINWSSFQIASEEFSSFMVELDCSLNLIRFKHFTKFSRSTFNKLIIDDKFGFLILGRFDDKFVSDIDSIEVLNEFNSGFYITNLDYDFKQKQIGFIKNGTPVNIDLSNDKIIGFSKYRGDCSLNNDINFENKYGMLLFETSEFEKLESFNLPTFQYVQNELGYQNEIQIFPNPFKDEFQIRFNCNAKFTGLYDVLGRDLTSKINYEDNFNKMIFNSMNLSPGVYFLKITTDKEKIFKIIKTADD